MIDGQFRVNAEAAAQPSPYHDWDRSLHVTHPPHLEDDESDGEDPGAWPEVSPLRRGVSRSGEGVDWSLRESCVRLRRRWVGVKSESTAPEVGGR